MKGVNIRSCNISSVRRENQRHGSILHQRVLHEIAEFQNDRVIREDGEGRDNLRVQLAGNSLRQWRNWDKVGVNYSVFVKVECDAFLPIWWRLCQYLDKVHCRVVRIGEHLYATEVGSWNNLIPCRGGRVQLNKMKCGR